MQFDRKILKHNLIFNLLDGSFFGFGLGLASFSTIIPLFVANLTNSALLIGLIPAIHNVGWQFPQLLTADRVSKLKYFKPWVLLMTINERLPFLGFAIVALLVNRIGVKAALILTFLLLIWQGLGAGFTANAWQNLISKIIPSSSVATFLGVQSALSNLMGGISAILAGVALEKLPQPHNYFTVFVGAFLFFVFSWLSLKQTKEDERVIPPPQPDTLPFWKNVRKIMRQDKIFVGFLASRFLSQFGMMAFAFYTIYAVEKLGMDNLTVGIMTSVLFITQTIANPLLGWLADRWSRKWILVIGGVCTVASVALALYIHDDFLFSIPFILYGVANTAYWTIGMTMTLDFGDEREKPTYVGMSNTFTAPATIVAPILGGFLADQFSYATTFYVSAICGMVSLVILLFMVHDPETNKELS